MKDINNLVTKALPAAGASASTDPIDLGALTLGPAAIGGLEYHVKIPALPSLVDAKNVVVEIEDCDTVGGAYASVPGTGNFGVVGAGGDGSDAVEFRAYLPPGTRQFIRATATVDAAGGDNTAVEFEFSLVF